MKEQTQFHHRDAPITTYTHARYVDAEDQIVHRSGVNAERYCIRRFAFRFGRSTQRAWLVGEYMDDLALKLLEATKAKNQRLVIQYHQIPYNKVFWCHLTAFGLYHRLKNGNYVVVNPHTGEEDFYYLSAE